MKILVVSNLYPPNVVGGYEQLCFDVTSELARRGHTITVLTSDWGSKIDEYPGQDVYRSLRLLVGSTIYEPFSGDAAERARTNTANIDLIKDAIETHRPDAIFVWNLFFLDRSAFDVLTQSGIRTAVVLTDNWLLVMHDAEFTANYFKNYVYNETVPETSTRTWSFADLGRKVLAKLWRTPQAPAGPPTDGIAIYSSEFMRSLYRLGGLNFRQEQIVHNGVRIHPQPESAFRDRSRLVCAGELRLLFAGRVTMIKGTHTALEALPLLKNLKMGVDTVRLTILGDTTDTAYLTCLNEMVEKLGLWSNVEFRPAVTEDRLFQVFQDHDVYVFPSLYEPYSLTLLHALAAGIPTAASKVGGNVEIIRERETGLLFEKSDPAGLAQSVKLLAKDPTLRRRVSAKARDAVKDLTLERMVDRLEPLLRASK